MFGLKATYLWDNWIICISQLQSNGRNKRYAYIKSPVPDFSEITKLNRIESNGNKLVMREGKTPSRTIYSNNIFIKSSILLESLPNISTPKPVNPAKSSADKPLKQNVKNL